MITQDSLRARRGLVALILGSGLVLGLAACTPTDEISARLVGERIEFAICRPIDLNQVKVSLIDKRVKPYKPHTVWMVDGTPIAPLSSVTYGSVPEGMSESVAPESLALSDMKVTFLGGLIDESGELESGNFAMFEGSSLSADSWLRNDGSKSERACD